MKASSLQLRCWEGYEQPDFLAPFTQSTGIAVEARTLISDGQTAHAIANGEESPDILNINNAWVRDHLDQQGLIRKLDGRLAQAMHQADAHCTDPSLANRLQRWCFDSQGQCIGIAQRFGSFNLVVNIQKISRATAEQEGFALARDAAFRHRFGILLFDDFNLFHVCIAAGHNPFSILDKPALNDVAAMAQYWMANAATVTDDPRALNQQLVDGDIDFYLSGGVYTASPLRRTGHLHIRGITPAAGPIDGKGGVAFCEINSILESSGTPGLGEQFLQYLLSRDACKNIAMTPNTCNPLLQMFDPAVMKQFDRQQLEVMQWPGLDEEIARCADYQLMPSRSAVLEIWRQSLADSQFGD